MKRFAKPALAAGAVAFAVTLGMPQPSEAHSSGRVAAGAIIGLAAGAIIAGAINQSRYRAYYGYNTYYYPPYYPSGPVFYGYGGYSPYVAAPAPRYYYNKRYRHNRYYRHRGVNIQLHFNPYYPNY